MTPERTREVMTAYLEGHDVSRIAEDAVFTIMGSGQEFRGLAAINRMFDYFYEQAFGAIYEVKHTVIAAGEAVCEMELAGRQLMEVGGVAPTGREVRVPFCVVYELADDLIRRARVYFEVDALRRGV